MDSNFFIFVLQNLASRSLVDDVLKKVNGLKPIADELGVPLAQLAIAWCAANPNVSSVITGATKESQVSFLVSHPCDVIVRPSFLAAMHLLDRIVFCFIKEYMSLPVSSLQWV